MDQLQPSERTAVRRLPKRGVYDRESVYAILDEAFLCHVGFVADGQPFVIPTGHVRVDDTLYLHGSAASRMLRTAGSEGVDICVTVTLLDGLVLARSAFHHSMNYRSAVVLGKGRLVTEQQEKWDALHAFTDKVVPQRWAEARQPTAQEMKATSVLALPINEASAKVRTGPPVDDEEDYVLNVWAGVVPVEMQMGTPIPDVRLPATVAPLDPNRFKQR